MDITPSPESLKFKTVEGNPPMLTCVNCGRQQLGYGWYMAEILLDAEDGARAAIACCTAFCVHRFRRNPNAPAYLRNFIERIQYAREMAKAHQAGEGKMTVLYSCVDCGQADKPVAVPLRGDSDVVEWMEVVKQRVTEDHWAAKPDCKAQNFDLKVPFRQGDNLGNTPGSATA